MAVMARWGLWTFQVPRASRAVEPAPRWVPGTCPSTGVHWGGTRDAGRAPGGAQRPLVAGQRAVYLAVHPFIPSQFFTVSS
jgi:hypothetical protein